LKQQALCRRSIRLSSFATEANNRVRFRGLLQRNPARPQGPKKEKNMAYVSSNRTTTATTGFGSRLAEIRKELVAAWRAQVVYRQTLSELQALSERELNDLGLNRSMLRSIALEAAYGKKA
jgi:uncharacterized protein YjiS (DUF1127 family)